MMDKTQTELRTEWNLTAKKFSRLQKGLLDNLKAHLSTDTLPELGYFNGSKAKAYKPWEQNLLQMAQERQPMEAIVALYLTHHPHLRPVAAFLPSEEARPEMVIEPAAIELLPTENTALSFHGFSRAAQRDQWTEQTRATAATTLGNLTALRHLMRHTTLELFETAAVQDLHDGMTIYQQRMNQGLSEVAAEVKKSDMSDFRAS